MPRIGGGRVLALQVLVPNPAIRNLIREDKVHQIYSQQQIGQDKWHMQTLNQCLADLYLKKLITYEDAIAKSQEPEELKRLISVPNSTRVERVVRR
jgi:twitching motility protein PilT